MNILLFLLSLNNLLLILLLLLLLLLPLLILVMAISMIRNGLTIKMFHKIIYFIFSKIPLFIPALLRFLINYIVKKIFQGFDYIFLRIIVIVSHFLGKMGRYHVIIFYIFFYIIIQFLGVLPAN